MTTTMTNRIEGITIHGVRYSRAEFRQKLEQIKAEMQRDPKSAYRDPKHPQHAEAVEEMALAYKWLGGEIDEGAEAGLIKAWSEATQESQMATATDAPEIAALREMNQIASSREGREALQRAQMG